MKPQITSMLVAVLSLNLLVACGGASSRNASVWDTYDIRYPVPAASTVPVSRATIYDTYTADNDSYYTRPAFGSCTSADLASFTCD